MCTHQDGSSRRDMLKTLAWTSAGLLATTAMAAPLRADEARTGGPLFAPAPTNPTEALDALYMGNARFVDGKIIAPNRNMARLKEVAASQRPFAAFLGCADSRVPVEIVFDQGFGDVFVTRIAGNVRRGDTERRRRARTDFHVVPAHSPRRKGVWR